MSQWEAWEPWFIYCHSIALYVGIWLYCLVLGEFLASARPLRSVGKCLGCGNQNFQGLFGVGLRNGQRWCGLLIWRYGSKLTKPDSFFLLSPDNMFSWWNIFLSTNTSLTMCILPNSSCRMSMTIYCRDICCAWAEYSDQQRWMGGANCQGDLVRLGFDRRQEPSLQDTWIVRQICRDLQYSWWRAENPRGNQCICSYLILPLL